MHISSASRVKSHILKNLDFAFIAILQSLLFVSLLVVFLTSTQQANAQDIDSCNGQNLLNQLTPEALKTAQEEAATTPNGTGLFWKVTKDGGAPSWLYGTMHVTDPRILKLQEPVKEAIKTSQTVVIETLDLLDPVKAQGAIMMNPELTMFTDGQTLTSNMSEQDREFISQELKERGVSVSLVERLKPWMIMGMVATPNCEAKRKASGQQILDFEIIERAKSQGKSIDGLETIVEQISAMASLPIDFQIKGLLETLRLGNMIDDLNETMISLYLSEEIGLITPALNAVAKELGHEEIDEEGFGQFEALIILERNHLMAERATDILNRTNAFIAVGALHLPGKEGLVELLKQRGFNVERVAL